MFVDEVVIKVIAGKVETVVLALEEKNMYLWVDLMVVMEEKDLVLFLK